MTAELPGRVYLLGNCQAAALERAFQRRTGEPKVDVECRWLASPLTYLHSPGLVPAALQAAFDTPEKLALLNSRAFVNQFSFVSPADAPPRAFVFTLFHEEPDLFRHKRDGFVFYVSRRGLKSVPALRQWVQDNCAPVGVRPRAYIRLFFEMLARARERFPDVPVLVIKRASHLPIYAPSPFSYLEDWGWLSGKWEKDWCRYNDSIPRLHELDLDRVIGGAWAENGGRVERLLPYLRLKAGWRLRGLRRLTGGWPLSPRDYLERDIEHVHSRVWDQVVEHVLAWLETDSIQYRPHEVALQDVRPSRTRAVSTEEVEARITSGTALDWANVLEYFLTALPADHSRLLAERGDRFPADKYLLRTMRAYITLQPTRAAVRFLESHREHLEVIPHPDPEYRTRYRSQLDEMLALARRSA